MDGAINFSQGDAVLYKWLKICSAWMVLWLATADAMGATRYFRTIDPALLKDEHHRIMDIFLEGTYLMIEGNATAPFQVSRVLEQGRWKRRSGLIKKAGIDVSEVVRQARLKGSARFILISKSSFLLEMFEFDGKHETKRFEAEVGLGMDDCLPPEEGGRCYYTEPGIYRVRWKVYDPEGIEWCIPEFMGDEERYAEDLESGRRCFRDSLGKYALNIGSSYAIHGTNDPTSLGEKRSHGCIRIGIKPMETLFHLMNERDMVYIVP